MTCSDVRASSAGDSSTALRTVRLQTDFDAHVKSCPDCSDLVSDLKLIASEARQLAASEEPAPRVWVRIAAQLRAEGLIREPAVFNPAREDPAREPEPASSRSIILQLLHGVAGARGGWRRSRLRWWRQALT